MIRITLWATRGPETDEGYDGIILLCKSGVEYTNQTGGTACAHPVAEGAFVPCTVPTSIQDMFLDEWGGFTPEQADTRKQAVDAAFIANGLALELDLSRMSDRDAGEAWVPILVWSGSLHCSIHGIGSPVPGIMTWANSD